VAPQIWKRYWKKEMRGHERKDQDAGLLKHKKKEKKVGEAGDFPSDLICPEAKGEQGGERTSQN